MPRAIELLAHEAIDANLGIVLSRWEQHGTLMLDAPGETDERDKSLPRTYEFVLRHTSLAGLELLRLLAVSPMGFIEADLPKVVAPAGSESVLDTAQELTRRTLAYREGGRLRLHNTLHDYINRKHSPTSSLIATLQNYYLNLGRSFAEMDFRFATEDSYWGPLSQNIYEICWAATLPQPQEEAFRIWPSAMLAIITFQLYMGPQQRHDLVLILHHLADLTGPTIATGHAYRNFGLYFCLTADYEEAFVHLGQAWKHYLWAGAPLENLLEVDKLVTSAIDPYRTFLIKRLIHLIGLFRERSAPIDPAKS